VGKDALEGTVANILSSGECKTSVRFASSMTRVSKESCVERQKMTAKDCGCKVIGVFLE
jgi:hypothetical protein